MVPTVYKHVYIQLQFFKSQINLDFICNLTALTAEFINFYFND